MNEQERELDLLVAELESEIRLLNREIERLERRLMAAQSELDAHRTPIAKAPWPFPAPGGALL